MGQSAVLEVVKVQKYPGEIYAANFYSVGISPGVHALAVFRFRRRTFDKI